MFLFKKRQTEWVPTFRDKLFCIQMPKDRDRINLHEKTGTKGMRLSLFHIAATGIAVFLTFILLIGDHGPPIPPFRYTNGSLDCVTTKLTRLVEKNGLLSYTFSIEDPIEYPEEYLPNFMKIWVESQPFTFYYDSSTFLNYQRSRTEMSFEIPLQVSNDDVVIKSFCLNNQLDIRHIDVTRPASRVQHVTTIRNLTGVGVHIRNICYINGFVDLLTKSKKVSSRDLTFNGTPLNSTFLISSYREYREYLNITNDIKAVIIQNVDHTHWKQILFTLAPLAELMKEVPGRVNLYYFTKPLKTGLDSLKTFVNSQPKHFEGDMCFSDLMWLSTHENPSLNDHAQMDFALSNDFSLLRERIVKSESARKRIVLAPSLHTLENVTKEICPDCDVIVAYIKTDINQYANLISTANVFVGDHLTNLIHMIWLEPDNSTVIDLSPPNLSCNPWAASLAKRSGLNYIQLNSPSPSECSCSTFECYPAFPSALELDEASYRKAIKQSLERMDEEL